ncbi:MAG: hypothetical protein JWP91_820 [Fibrobacteres bacterium]|nr:hypothetical protein [Fibrobacterota bacterium]
MRTAILHAPGAMETARIAAALLAMALQACAPAKAPGGPGDADLFHGDRVTIDRDYIYLDDPVFVQSKSVYGHRHGGWFSFRLPLYFNAGRQDTLAFAPGGIRVRRDTAEADKKGPGRDSPAAAPAQSGCMADTGAEIFDESAIAGLFLDSARTLVLAPGRSGGAKVELNVYCREYRPPWGRIDTLDLAFRKSGGPEGAREAGISLPFHVSYRGPVVSILLGVGLLYAFTQAGLWISDP